MNLETSRIVLRPVQKTDMLAMYEWRNSDSYRGYFQVRRNMVTQEEFDMEYKRDLERSRHVQFIVWSKRLNRPIGLVYSYSYSQAEGHVFMGTFIEDDVKEKGYGAEVSVLFIRHLFDNFPIRKISIDVFSYNAPSLSGCENLGFVKEGEFREHRFYNGKYWNVVRMAMLRTETQRAFEIWDRLTRRLVNRTKA
jgi:RimJ/RimL family protein N-acetyltransferase